MRQLDRNHKMQSKFKNFKGVTLLLALSLVLSFLLVSQPAQAKKLDWNTGYFNLTAKTASASGKISSLSYYQVALRTPLISRLEFAIGYTLALAKTFSFNSDMGYGPDMGLVFFPFGPAAVTDIGNHNGLSFNQYEIFRPFISTNFHQRQFQSIQASYAGFSIGGGFEYWWKHNFALRALTQTVILRGPLKASAQESSVLGGITVEF